jgi:hypothetical protein
LVVLPGRGRAPRPLRLPLTRVYVMCICVCVCVCVCVQTGPIEPQDLVEWVKRQLPAEAPAAHDEL